LRDVEQAERVRDDDVCADAVPQQCTALAGRPAVGAAQVRDQLDGAADADETARPARPAAARRSTMTMPAPKSP